MNEWQPIETAPKDRRILVFNPYFGVYSSQYTVEYEDEDNKKMLPLSERRIKWAGFPLGLTQVGLGRWYAVATQWMPLPAPPSAALGSVEHGSGG